MIKKYSLLVLEKAVNHALSLDDYALEKIAPLHGKIIEIIINPLHVNFFIAFEDRQFKFLADSVLSADTIIHSNPLGLIRLSLLPASKARSLFNDKVRMSGDMELGQHVKKIFDELDIDWEGHLARFTGDVVAHQIGSLVKQGNAFQQQVSHTIRHAVTDYLQEELRLFPPREEIEDFFKDIDTLAIDVERLEAHIKLLMDSYEVD